MNLEPLKKQWNDYISEFESTKEMDIEKHIKMALKVSKLVREIERLEGCLKQKKRCEKCGHSFIGGTENETVS
jgi:hypothetical protein